MLRQLSDVEILQDSKPIGEGAFSVVVKCRHKASGGFYALKIVA